MTLEDWVKQYLNNAAMFPDDINAVYDRFVKRPENECFKDRWHDQISDYPVSLQAGLLISLKRTALDYIDEVCPDAWYRPIFVQ